MWNDASVKRKLTTAGAIVLLLGAATACSSTESEEPTDGSPILVTASQPAQATREAAIIGVLEIRDGCFIVTIYGEDLLVEWPYGTTLGDDGESVNVPGFGIVRMGDRLNAGGGYGTNKDQCRADGVQGTASIDILQ